MVIDFIVLILLALGFLAGWKSGLLTSLLNLLKEIIVFVVAYMLKGPVSIILIEKLPFIEFGGIFKGITSFNVLLYEGIAFLICAFVVSILFKILLKLSGLISKAFNATIILGLPNKIGGAIISVIRFYLISFIVIFILSLIPGTSELVQDSFISKRIVNNTPVLSDMTKDLNNTLNEFYKLIKNIDSETPVEMVDEQAIDILLKYDIIDKETLEILKNAGKINVENIDELMEKYN